MTEDPIMREVRRVRKELLAEYGNDIEALCAGLRKKRRDGKGRTASSAKRLARARTKA